MAKGQIRSNREIRKPKKGTPTASPQPSSGAKVSLGGASAAFDKKK